MHSEATRGAEQPIGERDRKGGGGGMCVCVYGGGTKGRISASTYNLQGSTYFKKREYIKCMSLSSANHIDYRYYVLIIV